MSRIAIQVMLAWCLAFPALAMAQIASVAGAQVVVAAEGEVRHANDQAVLTLLVEEQDKDKGAAASRVNLKMRQGIDIVKKEDPQAQLKTRGYYTYPIYADEAQSSGPRNRQPVAWRIGQHLDVTTKNLTGLPKLVAATQRTLALTNLSFGLSQTTLKILDEQRIAAAYQNLTERIGSIVKAMGRSPGEAVIDMVDFNGPSGDMPGLQPAMSKASMQATGVSAAVEEPSFEAGETTLEMKLVARIHFK